MNPRLEGMMKTGEVAEVLGVTNQTVRNYGYLGRLTPDYTSESGTRWYKREKVMSFLEEVKKGYGKADM